MAKGARSKVSKRKVDIADRTSRVLDLRRQGLTVREIAAKTGVSRSRAHQLLVAGIKSIPEETRDMLVAEIRERELGIIAAHWPRRRDPESAKVIQASDKTLITLFGLEAKKQVDVSGSLELTHDAETELLDRLARLAASAAEGSDPREPDASGEADPQA